MESNIAGFARELGEAQLAERFQHHARTRRAAITDLLWDAAGGQWRDLLLTPPPAGSGRSAAAGAEPEQPGSAGSGAGSAASTVAAGGAAQPWEQRPGVFASNWVPLYCGCALAGSDQAVHAVAALRASGLVQAAGVAVSLRPTGHQWDWPCCWPPIQVGPLRRHCCSCPVPGCCSVPARWMTR